MRPALRFDAIDGGFGNSMVAMATPTEPKWPLLPHEASDRPLREFRWDAGLTLEQCAAALNMPLLEYSDVERGRRDLTPDQREQLHLLLTTNVVTRLEDHTALPAA